MKAGRAIFVAAARRARSWGVTIAALSCLAAGAAVPRDATADSGPSATTVPAGFVGSGAWFMSTAVGWVVGEVPVRGLTLLRTLDGGAHWGAMPVPPTGGRSQATGSTIADYVSDVRFADRRNGWLFGRQLWVTHDGAATWHQLRLGNPVLALETVGNHVYAVAASCQVSLADCSGPVRLDEAHVDRDDWHTVLRVDVGSPPRPNGQLLVAGRTVYLKVHPHEFEDDLGQPPLLFVHQPGGRWLRRTIPNTCDWATLLAARTAEELFLSCQTDQGAGGSAPHEVHVSRNGGRTWRRIWTGRSVYFGPITITREGRFIADSTERLEVTRPNGHHETYLFNASGQFSEQILAIRFPSARTGFVLTGGGLYRTSDAGHTWHPGSYQPPTGR